MSVITSERLAVPADHLFIRFITSPRLIWPHGGASPMREQTGAVVVVDVVVDVVVVVVVLVLFMSSTSRLVPLETTLYAAGRAR